MPTILLIDDEPEILAAFVRNIFRDAGADLVVARTGSEGLAAARGTNPDVVLLDVHLPDRTGLDLYEDLRRLDARCPVVFVTGSSTTETAIEAVKRGAYDYLFKPVDREQLRKVVTQALEVGRRMRRPAFVGEQDPGDDRSDALIGRGPAMQEVYKSVGRVAAQDVIVLITGESGTGKEVVARSIYQHGKRADKPFLAINSAALPETLLESELFGHEKGAFTGADRRRIGKFEQCNGGTLFLDEIGEMSLATQAKMLRVLQDQSFERVGGQDTIRTDVRLLAATNRDLKAMSAVGRFRPDLYYRLSVFTIHLPPLRERPEDLPLLINHYLRRFNRELNKEIREIDPETLKRFRAYPWPGNIRELQSVLKQALLQATGSVLLPAFLPPHVGPLPPPPTDELEAFVRGRLKDESGDVYAECVRRMERQLLPMVLAHCRGSQVKASRVLGINRRTLRNKLRELGLLTSPTDTDKEEDE